jgi:hypothetical protein
MISSELKSGSRRAYREIAVCAAAVLTLVGVFALPGAAAAAPAAAMVNTTT